MSLGVQEFSITDTGAVAHLALRDLVVHGPDYLVNVQSRVGTKMPSDVEAALNELYAGGMVERVRLGDQFLYDATLEGRLELDRLETDGLGWEDP